MTQAQGELLEVEYETRSTVRVGDALVTWHGERWLVIDSHLHPGHRWELVCLSIGPLHRVRGQLHTMDWIDE